MKNKCCYLLPLFLLSSCHSAITNNVNVSNKMINISNDSVFVGTTSYKTYNNFNKFDLFIERGDKALTFELISSKEQLMKNGHIKLFLNSGDTIGNYSKGDYCYKLQYDGTFVVYDYSFPSSINKNLFSYEVSTNGVRFMVDYSSIIDFDKDSIVGISFAEYLNDINSYVPMIFDETLVDISNTHSYPRIDNEHHIFANTTNTPNPKWISKEKRRELLFNKPISFALRDYQIDCNNADDIHLGVKLDNDNVLFSFVGFGTFNENEYLHVILHNSPYHKNDWALHSDDLMLIVNRNVTSVFENVTSYFDYEDKSLVPTSVVSSTFKENTAYFELEVAIPFTSLAKIINHPFESFYLLALEHSIENGIYNSDPMNNMFYEQVSCGDPASQSSYALINLMEYNSSLTNEQRFELISDKDYSFANPSDVGIKEADDFYFNVHTDEARMSFDLVGFGVFNKHETISLTLHQGENTKGWNILASDYHFLITRNSMSYKTGCSGFFDYTNVNIPGGVNINHDIIFTQHDGYFTLSFSIPLPLLSSFNLSEAIYGYMVEFNKDTIYNCDPWNKAMRYQNEPCGDPALTSSYKKFN